MEDKEYNKLIENLFTPAKDYKPAPANATYEDLVARLFDSSVAKSTK